RFGELEMRPQRNGQRPPEAQTGTRTNLEEEGPLRRGVPLIRRVRAALERRAQRASSQREERADSGRGGRAITKPQKAIALRHGGAAPIVLEGGAAAEAGQGHLRDEPRMQTPLGAHERQERGANAVQARQQSCS